MPRLTAIEPAEATGQAADLLAAIKQKLGVAPNIFRTMANRPAVLESFLGFNEGLGGGRFDAATREAIALTVAGENACDYCASAHSAISKSLKVDQGEIDHRLAGRSSDVEIDAILTFARAVVANKGHVTASDLALARDAGLDDGDIVEIVANVALNIFTNYFNHVAETEIDFPVVRTGTPQAA